MTDKEMLDQYIDNNDISEEDAYLLLERIAIKIESGCGQERAIKEAVKEAEISK